MSVDVYENGARLQVLGITEWEDKGSGEKRSRFTQIGRAFVNRDGSLNIFFDFLPAAGQTVQIRTWEPREEDKSGGLADARPSTSSRRERGDGDAPFSRPGDKKKRDSASDIPF